MVVVDYCSPYVVDQQIDQQVSSAYLYTNHILFLHGLVCDLLNQKWYIRKCQRALIYRSWFIRTAHSIVVLVYILDFLIEF